MGFYLQFWGCEVATFTEHPGIIVSISDSSFHIKFRVDHPHLVLHLMVTSVFRLL